jgi:hypothetical protein
MSFPSREDVALADSRFSSSSSARALIGLGARFAMTKVWGAAGTPVLFTIWLLGTKVSVRVPPEWASFLTTYLATEG